MYLIKNPQIFKPRASYTQPFGSQLTQDARSARDSYIQAVDSGNPSAANIQFQILRNKIEERKQTLLKLASENPEEFLRIATLADEQQTFPEGIRENIEKRVDPEGSITYIHGDSLDKTPKSGYHYFFNPDPSELENSTNVYNLYSTENIPSEITSKKIEIHGISIGANLVSKAGDIKPTNDLTFDFSGKRQLAQGNKKVAVILVNAYGESRNPPFSKESIENEFNAENNSVKRFFEQSSFGKFSLSADVFGWYNIATGPVSSTPCEFYNIDDGIFDDDLLEWASLGVYEAKHQGVNLEGYDFISFMFPDPPTCSRSMLAFVLGGKAESETARRLSIPQKPLSFHVFHSIFEEKIYPFIHELGHNLSLGHANSVTCNGKSVDFAQNCITTEYGDKRSVMGIDTEDFNGALKSYLDWIPRSNVFNLHYDNQSGNYRLYAINSPSSGIQLITVAKSNNQVVAPRLYYYLEYRKQTNYTPPGHATGISVRLGLADYGFWNILYPPVDSPPTYAIDPFVRNEKILDGTFRDGDIFRDEINKIQIKQLSHTSEYAEVEIKTSREFDQGSVPPPNPPLSTTPTPSPPTNTLQVKEIIFIGGAKMYGIDGGSLSCDVPGINISQCVTRSFGKNELCSNNGAEEFIPVFYSNNTTKLLKVKLKGAANLCPNGQESNQEDDSFKGENITINAQCDPPGNNNHVKLTWDYPGKVNTDLHIVDQTVRASVFNTSFNSDISSRKEYLYRYTSGHIYEFWLTGFDKQGNNPADSIKKQFTCPSGTTVITPDKYQDTGYPPRPKLLDASCNVNTLALSWEAVEGATRYQMRGGPVQPWVVDYIPYTADGTDWTTKNSQVDRSYPIITNGNGGSVQCVGESNKKGSVCSYFESGLQKGARYKVWTNAVNPNITSPSENAYFGGLIKCKVEESGNGGAMPTAVASCNGNTVKVTVTNPDTNMQNHIRGFDVSDMPANQRAEYHPPTNWTDGVPDNKRLVFGEGNCNGKVCEYSLDAPSTGKQRIYKIWTDAYTGSGNNLKRSDNYYIADTVDCGVGTGGGALQSGATPTPVATTPTTPSNADVEIVCQQAQAGQAGVYLILKQYGDKYDLRLDNTSDDWKNCAAGNQWDTCQNGLSPATSNKFTSYNGKPAFQWVVKQNVPTKFWYHTWQVNPLPNGTTSGAYGNLTFTCQ